MTHHEQTQAIHIGVDARTVFAPRPRGTGRNLFDAYQRLAALRPNWHFTLYRQPGPDTAAPATTTWPTNVTVKTLKMRGDRWDLWLHARLPLAAWHDRVDLLHCPANALPRFCHAPLVATIHDLLPLQPEEQTPTHLRRRFDQHVTRATRHAARLIVPSTATHDELVAAYDADPNRISVIPWAPDELVLQQCRALRQDPERVAGVAKRYDLDHPWLLNFSGSSRRKNAYRIIDAVAELPPEIRMRCVVALTGCEPQAFRNELRTRAERLGVGSSVRLLGFVPHEDLPSLLVGARGLLIPSLGEGFGLPILDAFAADVPVLAAATSSLPEVAGEAAVYCNPRSTRSVADGIKTLLDPKEAGRLRLLGRQRVRVFSWEHTARLMAETFERVLTARALRTRYRLQPRLRLIPAPSKGGPL